MSVAATPTAPAARSVRAGRAAVLMARRTVATTAASTPKSIRRIAGSADVACDGGAGTCKNGVCATPEVCDGVDNDFDGATDEDTRCPGTKVCAVGVRVSRGDAGLRRGQQLRATWHERALRQLPAVSGWEGLPRRAARRDVRLPRRLDGVQRPVRADELVVRGGVCDNVCGTDQACCGSTCTTLGTNTNCADCNDACGGGQLCGGNWAYSRWQCVAPSCTTAADCVPESSCHPSWCVPDGLQVDGGACSTECKAVYDGLWPGLVLVRERVLRRGLSGIIAVLC